MTYCTSIILGPFLHCLQEKKTRTCAYSFPPTTMDIPQPLQDNNGDGGEHRTNMDAVDNIIKTVSFIEGDGGSNNNSDGQRNRVTITTTPVPTNVSTPSTPAARPQKRNRVSEDAHTHTSTPHPTKKARTSTTPPVGMENPLEREDSFDASRLSLEAEMEAELDMNTPEGGGNPNEEGLQAQQRDMMDEAGQLFANNDSPAASGEGGQEERQLQNQQEDETAPAEEPDWDKLAECEPSKTDVPIFLSATEKRRAAEERFGAALDECHSALTASVDALMNTAADMYSAYGAKMDALENGIKQDFEGNHRARVAMQERLQATATEAQAIFTQLLMRVVSVGGGASGRIAEQMQSSTTQALTNSAGSHNMPSNP